MAKIDSTVSVVEGSKLAVEMVSNGWITPTVIAPAAAALITISVVGFTTLLNYRNSKKMIEHQGTVEKRRLEAEHKDRISEFRHQWLYELRAASSEIFQIVESVKRVTAIVESLKSDMDLAEKQQDTEAYDRYQKRWLLHTKKVLELSDQYQALFAKLFLLFKPDDESLVVVNRLRVDRIGEIRGIDNQQFLTEMQKILKREWEVTKSQPRSDI